MERKKYLYSATPGAPSLVCIWQLVHPLESHILAYRWVEGRMDRLSRRERRRFVELGDPPFLDHHDYVAFAKIVDQLGGGMDVGYGKLFLEALKAGHYRPGDYRKWLYGANRGSGPM